MTPPGPAVAADAEAADLAVAVGRLDAGVVGAVVVEPPAEGLPVELAGAGQVGDADLDVVEGVV